MGMKFGHRKRLAEMLRQLDCLSFSRRLVWRVTRPSLRN